MFLESADPSPALEVTIGDAQATSTTRPAFARTSAERLAQMPVRRPEEPEDDDEEPLRGTMAPVLRHSTARAQYPPRATPVVPPPAGEPGSARAATPPQPPTWQEALAGDVLPGGKRARPERVSRPRHESVARGTTNSAPHPTGRLRSS